MVLSTLRTNRTLGPAHRLRRYRLTLRPCGPDRAVAPSDLECLRTR
jgi:hypothetical protein